MDVIVNGEKYTVPDNSTHVAVDDNGYCLWHIVPSFEPYQKLWRIMSDPNDQGFIVILDPPIDFTKCLAEVSDGCVIDFRGM